MSAASFRILISLVLTTAIALAGTPKQPLPHNSPQKPAPLESGMMPMPLVAPLFVENEDYESSVTMINELAMAVHGTIIARNTEGVELARRKIRFEPHSRTVLLVSDLIAGTNEALIIGSLELIPDPMEVTSMAIAAQLSIIDNRTAPVTYLEEEFISMDPMLPSTYRAVVPSAIGPPGVAVLNTSTSPQQVEIRCMAENSTVRRSITLGPKQVSLLSACGVPSTSDDLDAAKNEFEMPAAHGTGKERPVALDVSGNGTQGSLAVWGFANIGEKHETRIALNFSNPSTLRSADTIFPGIPVGSADLLPGDSFIPNLAVANFGTKPAEVSVSYSSISGNTPEIRTIAKLSVAAGVVKRVPMPDLSGDPLLRNSFVVTSAATPGSLISNLILQGRDQYPAVQLIGKDPEVNNGGGHPWSLRNSNESTVLLFNNSDKAQLFNVNISSNGITNNWHQEYTLQPAETKAISIGELLRHRTPDMRGELLSLRAIEGEVSWFTADPGKGAGRLLVSNPETALARNFSCGYNIVMCGSYLTVSTATFAVGGTGSLGPIGAKTCTAYDPHACSGQSYGTGGGGYTYSWSSNNTSITTISGSSTNPSGTFLGKSPGTAIGQGNISNGTGCAFVSDGTNNVVNIQVYNGGSPVGRNWIVYISAVPQMPNIQAQLAGAASGASVSWSLQLTYQPGDGISYNGNFPGSTSGTALWTVPWSTSFVGGNAILTATYQGVPITFPFIVEGTNPAATAIDSYISGQGGPWFWPLIISEESRYQQFSGGNPLFGPPHGFGLSQVDPPPSVYDLWNWQQDLSAGLAQLNTKQNGAFGFWNNQVTQWNQWNSANPGLLASGAYSNAGGPCQFQFPDVGGTYDFEYAEWIKAYNGASVYYIYLVNNPPAGRPAYWVVDDTLNQYVEHVCQAPRL